MSSYSYILDIPPFDRAKQKNRKYWKLQEILHEDYKLLPSAVAFDPTDEYRHSWICIIGFVDTAHYSRHAVLRPSEWFETEVIRFAKDTQFNVRVGIVRKSGKEIAVSNAEVISPEKHTAEFRLMHRSKFLKMMLSYKELEFFIERNEKDEESEENKKFHIQKFRTGYKELLLSGRISDFTINVKSMKFEVHRSILGARSPVFSAMMEHEMKEKRSGEVSIIDADPAVFKEFLLYLYTGDEEQLDWKNVAELYELADKYLVEDLKYLSVKRMKTHISIENFVKIFYISQQLNNSELSEGVIQFFLEDEKEITASEKYIEFAKKHREETYILEKALKADIETQ